MIDFLIWVLLIAIIVGVVWLCLSLGPQGELMAGIWVAAVITALFVSYPSSKVDEESLSPNTAIEQTSESVSSQPNSITTMPSGDVN